jgi:hypothetical protein
MSKLEMIGVECKNTILKEFNINEDKYIVVSFTDSKGNVVNLLEESIVYKFSKERPKDYHIECIYEDNEIEKIGYMQPYLLLIDFLIDVN